MGTAFRNAANVGDCTNTATANQCGELDLAGSAVPERKKLRYCGPGPTMIRTKSFGRSHLRTAATICSLVTAISLRASTVA